MSSHRREDAFEMNGQWSRGATEVVITQPKYPEPRQLRGARARDTHLESTHRHSTAHAVAQGHSPRDHTEQKKWLNVVA